MDKLLIIVAVGCVIAMANAYKFKMRPHYVRTPLGDSIDASTMKVLQAAYETAKDKNIVSSPLGLMMLLSLYNEGAGDATKREINKFLGGSRQASDRYQELSSQLSAINGSYLTVANKISVSNLYSLNEQFSAAARRYHCDLDTLDFSKPDEAAAAINEWAAEKTEGHITHPVNEDMLTPDIVAALYNVIFFKGQWHVPFKSSETKDKDFHVSRKEVVKKPMMHLFRSLYYAESKHLGARMIELPYKEERFRMVVVLPNKVDGLPSVLKNAARRGLLTDVFRLDMAGTDVDLDMPKFSVRSKLDFNNILPKIGVSKIFTEGAQGIVKGASVTVSKVFQEAFIEVDEEGATAGAFTGAYPIAESDPPHYPTPMKFTVDRPFLYAILHDDKILFAGTYSH